MAKTHSAAETVTTVTPMLREDGTVYFHYEGKTTSQRLCEWTLGFLWFLVVAVTVAALVI